MRDDSTWNQLTPEQRETLESWLFDENLGYVKTVERVQEEFGLEATIASVGRFYRLRARGRQVAELVEAQAAASELNGLPVSVASLREAAVKLVGKAALKLVGENHRNWSIWSHSPSCCWRARTMTSGGLGLSWHNSILIMKRRQHP